MALVILDGTQTATTLSTILSSGQHIPAHTVVSLGTQAITDIVNATSAGLTNTQLRASVVSVGGTITIGNSLTIGGGTITIGAGTAQIGSVTASISGTVPISISSVTIGNFPASQAVTFSAVSISNFPASQSTTFGAVTGSISVLNFPATQAISISSVTIGNSITISSVPPISGSVTLGAGNEQIGSVTASISGTIPISISSVTIGNFPATQPVSLTTLPALVGSTAQIGSVTASISGTIPVSISSVTIGNSITISSLPSLVAGTAQIGSVTVGNSITIGSIVTHGVTIANTSVTVNGTFFQATQPISISSVTIGNFPATQPVSIASVTIGNSITIGSLPAISGTVTANLSISSTAITSGSFASLTSATLVPANTARKMATVYNLGAGQLFVNAGATATTLGGGFMVALSSGDFYECNYTTTTLSAIFATAGTASWISH